MEKYFLGSVGEAEAYQVNIDKDGNATMSLVFTSKTLTDSAVNISMTKETLTTGLGNAPVCSLYHSPNVSITLTDILWTPAFLAAQLGTVFTASGNEVYYTPKLQADSEGKICLINNPAFLSPQMPTSINLPITKDASTTEKAMYPVLQQQTENMKITDITRPATDWITTTYDSSTHLITGLVPNAYYRFKYLVESASARSLVLSTNLVPKELYLIIRTPLFEAGFDQCISNGKHVASVVYDVPRWSLDGNLNLANSMSNNTTLQLTGTALAIDANAGDKEGAEIMKIIQVESNKEWYEGLVDITMGSDETIYVASNTIIDNLIDRSDIMGIYADGSVQKLNKQQVACSFTKLTSTTGSVNSSPIHGSPGYYYGNSKLTVKSGTIKVTFYPFINGQVWTFCSVSLSITAQ